MSNLKLIAFAAMMVIGAAHLANAASPNSGQDDRSARSQVYAQASRSELPFRLAQDPAATSNAWAVTDSGVQIQSRAGFVGYH
jgi:hypothetical protein